MSERKKILWLVSWYPNKYDAFDGDFIQRHARAAALYDDIHVLFIKQSESQEGFREVKNSRDGLTEQILYLPKKKGLFGKFSNYRSWTGIYKARIKLLMKEERPHLVHVHVPWKAGLLALWMKKKYNIPYLVTEHWGIYNRVVSDNIYSKSFVLRYMLRRIYQDAKAFISVSRYVGEGVGTALVKKAYEVVPNVVDTSLFKPAKEKYSRFTFLHVSNMVPLKNVEGILLAFSQFLQQVETDAQLILVGNRDHRFDALAKELNLPDTAVFFRGEVSYSAVAKEMQRAHVFVLNSNIENSPCVIGEALCCGLPVIATNVGGIPELIDETSGILVKPGDVTSLTNAMIQLYQNPSFYNDEQISYQACQKFSFQVVGQAFHSLYASN